MLSKYINFKFTQPLTFLLLLIAARPSNASQQNISHGAQRLIIPTELIIDACKNGNFENLPHLFGCGGVVTVQDLKNGFTPLHYAARAGNIPAVKFLLEKGAVVNAKNNPDESITPLLCACLGNHTEIAKILLSQGANPNLRDGKGNTPLHLIDDPTPEIVSLLISHGADLNAKNFLSETPLCAATKAFERAKKTHTLYPFYSPFNKAPVKEPKRHYIAIFFGIEKKIKTKAPDSTVLDLMFFIDQKAGSLICTKSLMASALHYDIKINIGLCTTLKQWHCKEISPNWILLIPDPEKNILPRNKSEILINQRPSPQEFLYGFWISHMKSVSVDMIKKFSTELIPTETVKPSDKFSATKELIQAVENEHLFVSKNHYIDPTKIPQWITLLQGHGSASYVKTIKNKSTYTLGTVLNSHPTDIKLFLTKLCEETTQRLIVNIACYSGGKNAELFSNLESPLLLCTCGNASICSAKLPLHGPFFAKLDQTLEEENLSLFEDALSKIISIPSNAAECAPYEALYNIPLLKIPKQNPKIIPSPSIFEVYEDKSALTWKFEYPVQKTKLISCIVALESEDIHTPILFTPPSSTSKVTNVPTPLYPVEVPLFISRVPGTALHTIDTIGSSSCKASSFVKALCLSLHHEKDEKAIVCKTLILQDDLFSDKEVQQLPLKTFTLYVINRELVLNSSIPNLSKTEKISTQALLIPANKEAALELIYNKKAVGCFRAIERKKHKVETREYLYSQAIDESKKRRPQ